MAQEPVTPRSFAAMAGGGPAMDRRAFLGQSGRTLGALTALGGLGALAGCASGSPNAGQAPDPGISLRKVQSARGTVNVLGWAYYEVPQANTTQVASHWGYLGKNEDTITKTAQPGAFDLLTILAGYDDELLAAGRVVPTNPALLSNWHNIDPAFRNSPTIRRNGEVYSVPFQWGYGYLEWDKRHTTKPTSLADLFSSKLTKKIGLPNDPYGVMTTFALLLGFNNPQRLRPDQFKHLTDTLNRFKPQVLTLHDYGAEPALLARGDIWIDFPAYGPSFLTARQGGAKTDFELFGSWSYVDCTIMVRGAKEVPALAYMNRTLLPEVQAAVVAKGAAFPVVDAAVSAVPNELQYSSVASVLHEAPLQPGVPVDGKDGYVPFQQWVAAWEQFQAL
jgi:spermidine/putrescine-binding protein